MILDKQGEGEGEMILIQMGIKEFGEEKTSLWENKNYEKSLFMQF